MCQIDWELVPVWIQGVGSLGGLFALIFLWQTLRSQNKTLKEQQRLTDLEHKRYIESNSPNIVIKEIQECSCDNFECISITLEIKNNYLLNFRYTENLSSLGKLVEKDDDIIGHNSTYNVGECITFKLSNKKCNVIIKADGILEGFGIHIFYDNKFGHSFTQVLYYSGDKYIYISPPLRV